jgi:cytochrome c2
MKQVMKFAPIVGVLALLTAVGCSGEPGGRVRAQNLANATAAPATGTAIRMAQVTPDFVVLWLLQGTPTATPFREGYVGPVEAGSTPAAVVGNAEATPNSSGGAAVAAAPTTGAAATTPAPSTMATATLRPTNTAAAVASAGGAGSVAGDPAIGQRIFTQISGCNACHDVTAGTTIVGPSLKGIASRAANRQPGVDAATYLRDSILNPNKFVVQGFTAGLMPQTFGTVLSPQQLDDVIAYMMTLK